MSNKAWRIDLEGQVHTVEVKAGTFLGSGSLTVDGKEIRKWGISLSGFPTQKFDLQGKQAEIRRKGFLNPTPTLYLEGKKIQPIY